MTLGKKTDTFQKPALVWLWMCFVPNSILYMHDKVIGYMEMSTCFAKKTADAETHDFVCV